MSASKPHKIACNHEFVILYYWCNSTTHLVRAFDVDEHISVNNNGVGTVDMFNALTHEELWCSHSE